MTIAVLLLAAFQLPADSSITVTFLDVGQGDAVVIRHLDRVVLYDAGPASIMSDLQRMEIDTIHLAIASHAHADHIGGMAEVLQRIPVLRYMDNGLPHTTRTYRRVLAAVETSDPVYLRPTDRTITFGNASLRVIAPPGLEGQNDNSVAVEVTLGDFVLLLTGDSEQPQLEYLYPRVSDVTVLKAAHHGSRDAVTPRWLQITSPEVVVISAGSDNRYGHPHDWALRYYRASGRAVYRTDLHGDVTIRGAMDGTFAVSVARGGS